MNFHPAANIFPLLEGADFAALVADMAAHGQREPIVTHAGMILDGRNRWRACVQLGLTPVTREWVDDGDAKAFVVSLNLHRRHLTREQRDDLIRSLRADGMTLQKIAGAVGVSYGTVHAATELINSDKLMGADGKARPTHYAPRQAVEPEDEDADKPDDYEFNRQQILEANRQGACIEVPPAYQPKPESLHVSDDSYEWFTPSEYIEAARRVMGSIDTDPASCEAANEVVAVFWREGKP